MTKGHLIISEEVRASFDDVKYTDKLDYAFYQVQQLNKHSTVVEPVTEPIAEPIDEPVAESEGVKYPYYKNFLAHFKDDTPLYAVVKVKYRDPVKGEQRHKLVFITWVPEKASRHDKECYTWNKNDLYLDLCDGETNLLAKKKEDLEYDSIMKQFKVL